MARLLLAFWLAGTAQAWAANLVRASGSPRSASLGTAGLHAPRSTPRIQSAFNAPGLPALHPGLIPQTRTPRQVSLTAGDIPNLAPPRGFQSDTSPGFSRLPEIPAQPSRAAPPSTLEGQKQAADRSFDNIPLSGSGDGVGRPGSEPPLPSWPRPKAREVVFNGRAYKSVVTRPEDPIEPELVALIKSARKSVRLALYDFTLESVLEALRWLRENRPGVAIEIVIDRSHVYTAGRDSRGRARLPSPQIAALVQEGFAVLILRGERSGIMHSKYLVVDAEDAGLVFTGSYNLSNNSERHHFENGVFSTETGDVQDYLGNFAYMRGLAQPVDPDKLKASMENLRPQSLDGLELPSEAQGLDTEEDLRDSKFPPPPANPETPFDLNGEKFQRSYFSPQGGILDAWLRAIGAARESIEIAMFGFYSRRAAEALVEALAKKKRVNPAFAVSLSLDAGQSASAKLDGIPVSQWLAARGMDVKMVAGPNPDGDRLYEKQHSKYLVIDQRFVITGSFNLSDTAENYSFENATVIMDAVDVSIFVWDFARLRLRGWAPPGV